MGPESAQLALGEEQVGARRVVQVTQSLVDELRDVLGVNIDSEKLSTKKSSDITHKPPEVHELSQEIYSIV